MPLDLKNNDAFQVWQPLDLIKGESAKGEEERRISGIASTENLDRQNEIVLQKGLDFNEFVNFGYFNDNHNQATAAVVGVPEEAEFNPHKGWSVTGHLLKGFKRADEIWDLAKALQGTKRRLGFSIEGKVIERRANYVVKAKIRNIAVTNCPVNTDCTWAVVAKSFDQDYVLSKDEENEDTKALEATGNGSPLIAQDLEGPEHDELEYVYACPHCDKAFGASGGLDRHLKARHGKKSKVTRKSVQTYTVEEAVQVLGRLRPHLSESTRRKIVEYAARG